MDQSLLIVRSPRRHVDHRVHRLRPRRWRTERVQKHLVELVSRLDRGQGHHRSRPAQPDGLLAKIQPAVVATAYQGERSAKNCAFVDAVARKNVELTMAGIHSRSEIIAALETKGAVKIAEAMYTLESGQSMFCRPHSNHRQAIGRRQAGQHVVLTVSGRGN